MTVGTVSGPGTRADEAPAWDRGDVRPGDHDRGTPEDHDREKPGDDGEAKQGDDDRAKRDHLRSLALALGIAAVAFAAAWALHGNALSTYRIDSHWGAFTGMFILALAIERALEPISPRLGPNTTEAKKKRDLACALADDKAAHKHAQDAVTCRHEVDRCRRLTAVVTWGAATGLAFVLCSALNITLMQAVRTGGSGAPPFWADLLVTGLVVGAGTKPLHDLVSSIDRVKEGRPADGDGRR
jgi:hypothetical protein